MNIASGFERSEKVQAPAPEVLLGEDWVEADEDGEIEGRRRRSGFAFLNSSPLARKIIIFNLLGLIILVTGVLYLNPFRDSLVIQAERGIVSQSRLIAHALEAQQAARAGAAAGATAQSPAQSAGEMAATLSDAGLAPGSEAFLFDPSGKQIARVVGSAQDNVQGLSTQPSNAVITNFLSGVWNAASSVLGGGAPKAGNESATQQVASLVPRALGGKTVVQTTTNAAGHAVFTVATPIMGPTGVTGVVAVASAAGEIDQLVSNEREQVLQMFVIAILVSIGLSLVLASTIANPLSDLAAAAELGRDKNARKMSPGRVRIPDLTARPDEIGRLSVALRGMVAALYDRIEANEQFASDVAHEIKNPLASLRSAVASLRMAKKDEQRDKLLSVIDHDVRRLDRLVSDISNASRLDAELVKEEEERFNLLKTISNITEYLGQEAVKKRVDFITDLPSEPIMISGLEGRLAQVFVNLITNAISFCEEGDAVRVWARKRENRILVVVEDTGPGIPDQALGKIFKRFYSERPPGQFGDHSGLGLAISKQIVEAHGGVIWAENIRPTDADPGSEPLGARFVVGLPV
ncbi:sensor histidine kinase [Solirhodobacter olei]|uniref:sensor histidine kinase n=1 Tax=Solirhodobacter olei TaxID=2493082 RepID=UPI000FDC1661|nr:sensor histidine kinase [Solirhodobacter olei]